tara:strand:+ start:834 stop:1574 length:741 start_codon:yes stop_codon:yes gene_type:complete
MTVNNLCRTLEDVRTFAKVLLDETGDLFWSETQQNRLANEANRAVFRELVQSNPEFFLESTSGPFTWAQDTESIDITAASYLNGQIPYKIVGVEGTPENAAVSPDNLPSKWKPMRFADRWMIQNRDARTFYGGGRHYCLAGKKLFVAPIPEKALNFHIYWIKNIEEMTADSHVVLRSEQDDANGAAESFGDLVAVYMAKLMNAKQNGQNMMVEQMWQEGLLRMQNYAQSRNVDEPMSVRATRGPWE